MTFLEKLEAAIARNGSLLCVGLDPDPKQMPVSDILTFNCAIIEATVDLVCAYKPNFAFYEQFGPDGLRALQATIAAIPPEIPIIGDAKRGDIGHTSVAYARAVFEVFGCDAITVSPYLGRDALDPFLAYTDRAVFILCRTSNPGARDFQDLDIAGQPLYEVVARRAREWNTAGNIGLVVGATYPTELARVRALCPNLPLLIPGLGAQAADIAAAVAAGVDARGSGAIFNASRQVLYAGQGANFAAAARREALRLRDQIAAGLAKVSR